MKVLFYELNEVSWRVIDYYTKLYPHSSIATILEHSIQRTTHTKDSGELHPWSTWPTMHRGVYNDAHDIRFLNQEITTNYAPYWQPIAQAGFKVGIFGCLQSWPIPKETSYDFYVPDTFAPGPQAHPAYLTLFQSFNLAQTARDGGTTPKSVSISLKTLRDLVELSARGITFKTLFMLGKQLLREKLNPLFKSRRSIFQSPLAFDFFQDLIQRKRPDLAIFFTNHMAGMLHRYWKYAFPEDFSYTLQNEKDALKADNILQALHITDYQIGKLKKFADTHDYTLMIGSSMGQVAIDRGDYVGELRIQDFHQFYKYLGYEGAINNHLAMQPDFAFSFKTKEKLKDFRARVASLKTVDNNPLFTFKESGLTLNCNLQSSPPIVLEGGMYRDGEKIPFNKLGIRVEMRDQGTAYHHPEGIWITYKNGLKKDSSRTVVESTKVAPTLLKLFRIKAPSYMPPPEQSIIKAL